MIQIDVRAITLFFFYATLDEKRAIEAASEAFEQARKKSFKKSSVKIRSGSCVSNEAGLGK